MKGEYDGLIEKLVENYPNPHLALKFIFILHLWIHERKRIDQESEDQFSSLQVLFPADWLLNTLDTD